MRDATRKLVQANAAFVVFGLALTVSRPARAAEDGGGPARCAEVLDESFSGRDPFPVGFSYLIKHPTDSRTMTVRVERLPDGPSKLRSVFKILREKSVPKDDATFREAGGFYFTYPRDLDSFIVFSSNLPAEIDGEVALQAIEREGILAKLGSDANEVGAIYHVRTHPGIELRRRAGLTHVELSLLPSWQDYTAYEYFASLFTHHAKRRVPCTGLVLPMYERDDDVFFVVVAEPNDEVIAEIQHAELLKRALSLLGPLRPDPDP